MRNHRRLHRCAALLLLLMSFWHQAADALELAGLLHMPETHQQADETDPAPAPDCSSPQAAGCDHCHGHTHVFIGTAGSAPEMPFSSASPYSHEPFARSVVVLPGQRPPIL